MLRTSGMGLVALAMVLSSSVFAEGTNCSTSAACERECERGVGPACTRAGGQTSDSLRAFGLYQRGCESGDGEGCAKLADIYRLGKGIRADPQRAFQLDSTACEQRHGPSCLMLGRAFEQSAGGLRDLGRVAQELGRAAQLFFKACEAGATNGCAELARLYVWGAGIKADPVGGALLAQKGCDRGDDAACRFLGALYESGVGVKQDAKKASDLYRKARDTARDKPLMVPPVTDPRAAALVITSEPPGAAITVDALLAGRAPLTVLVPPGPHTVEATHPGRDPERQRLTAAPGSQLRVGLLWPVQLRVETTPSGAKILLNGAAVGTSPFKKALPPGRHVITAQLPGYLPTTREVTLGGKPEQSESLKLEQAPGAVVVSSSPPGASLSVDGAVVGVTPWSGDLAPGRHALVFELAEHSAVRRTITVKPGTPTEESVTLEPIMVALKVNSTPLGAELTLNGAQVGKTPWSGRLAPGKHQLAATKPGHFPASLAVVLTSEKKNESVSLSLKVKPPAPVAVRITSTPDGAAVRLDGSVVGVTAWSGELLPGKHALELQMAGHRAVKKTLIVAAETPLAEQLELEAVTVKTRITSGPAGAVLTLDGAPQGPTPWSGSLPPGGHTVSLALDGYLPLAETVLVPDSKPSFSKSFSLKKRPPKPARLTVTSTPPGAQVLVDADAVGATPWTGEVAPGRRAVAVSLAGHLSVKRTLTLAADAEANESFALEPKRTAVSITSTPSGAALSVDGSPVGTTPFKGALAVGARTLGLSLDGYLDATVSLEVADQKKPVTSSVTLKERPATLRVTTTPPGARVSVDEKPVGTTPWEGAVEPGLHSVSVALPGFAPEAGTVESKLRTAATRHFDLTASAVLVTVETLPPGAALSIDGAPRGNSPATLQVLPGPHTLSAALPGHRPASAQYELAPGPTATWRLTLTSEQAETPPPTPPSDLGSTVRAHAAVLSNPQAPLAAKEQAMSAIALTQGDVTHFLMETQPPSARATLCRTYGQRVQLARLVVTAVDGFREPAPSTVVLDGQDLGPTPYDGMVPQCASSLSVRHTESGEVRDEAEFTINPRQANNYAYRFGDHQPVAVVGLFGDVAYASPGWGNGAQMNPAAGLRFEYWGQYFHFSVAGRAGTLFTDELPLPVVPGLDVTVGLGGAFGQKSTRFRFAFDLGVTTLVVPTTRLTLALSFNDFFFISLAGNLHLHPFALVPPDMNPRYQSIARVNFLFYGATLGLGFGF